MRDLYPLLLLPEFRERVWGTRNLAPLYAEAPGSTPIGEVWLTGDECKVANGPLAGRSLGELCRRHGRDLVGEAAPQPDRFPLLIKFLFPRDKLSVQVHPDDETAQRAGLPCGKTECWYVLAAEPGAQIGLGLRPGTTRGQLEQAIGEKRAEALLNWVQIHAGDVIYVDAGTVHTIGPGSILVETQQNSDTTYRLYDYGRPRELHVREGLEAVKEKTRAGKVPPGDAGPRLVASPCFVVERHQVTEKLDFAAGSRATAQVLVGLEGCGVVECEGCEPVSFVRGEAVVVPASVASYRLRPQWETEFIRALLPAGQVPEPVTML
jgi:mannose-6-phosphate isomerase